MGFDQYSKDRPLVDVKKADTKTNLLVVAGVAVFFVVAAALLFYYMRTPAETRNEAHQDQMSDPNPAP